MMLCLEFSLNHMAIIKCKMCSGDAELSPEKAFGTCEFCGSTMTFPKVRSA